MKEKTSYSAAIDQMLSILSLIQMDRASRNTDTETVKLLLVSAVELPVQ